MAWTNPLTWETGQVVSASDLNTHLRDNERYLRGRVLAQWPASTLATSTSDVAVGPELSSVISGAAYEYRFADDASQKVYGYFAAPPGFVGDTPLVAKLYWTASSTTGAARWEISLGSWSAGELPNTHVVPSDGFALATVATTANHLSIATITVALPDIAANDLVCLQVARNSEETTDTMTGDARLHFVQLEVG